jgi:hypothetical protein
MPIPTTTTEMITVLRARILWLDGKARALATTRNNANYTALVSARESLYEVLPAAARMGTALTDSGTSEGMTYGAYITDLAQNGVDEWRAANVLAQNYRDNYPLSWEWINRTRESVEALPGKAYATASHYVTQPTVEAEYGNAAKAAAMRAGSGLLTPTNAALAGAALLGYLIWRDRRQS